MKEFKGTKGEWKFDIDGFDGEGVIVTDGENEINVVCDIWANTKEQRIANAHLIVASPDLLEALQEIHKYVDTYPELGSDGTHINDLAKQAINKALNI